MLVMNTVVSTGQMIAALDLTTDRLIYRIRDRRICDNFSPHKHPEVRNWCATNRVDLMFLFTYASWLNWIEAEFTAVRYVALNGTDHRTHTERTPPSAPTSAGATNARMPAAMR